MKSNLITPEILHIQFENQYLLCSSFMRLQEFYESDIPGFVGKYFSREEFEDAYAIRFGNFTYYTDWCGFNIPRTDVDNFVKLFEPTFSNKESALIKTIYENSAFKYVIGTHANDGHEIKTLRHEVSHAMFSTNEEYRVAGTEIVEKYFATKAGKRYMQELRDKGYHEKVLIDEAIAYHVEGKNKYSKLFNATCKKLNIKF